MVEEATYIKEFLEEISETLNQLDRQFIALEQNPSDRDCLAEIFRNLHTIKGSCGLLGLGKLESIAHSGENLLGKLRDGDLALRSDMVNTLLEMMDAVWKMVACLKKEGHEGDADYSKLIGTLALLEKGESPSDKHAVDQSEEEDFSSPIQDPSMTSEFLEEAYEILNLLDQQIVELETTPASPKLLNSLLRSFHTLKGSSGYMNFTKLETLTHSMENVLITLQDGKAKATTSFFDCLLKMMDTLRKVLSSLKEEGTEGDPPVGTLVAEMVRLQENVSVSPTSSTSASSAKDDAPQVSEAKDGKSDSTNIRVDVELLDSLMDLVGEVVLARNQVSRLLNKNSDSVIQGTSQSLNRVTTELQEMVMKARMQPIKNVWGKLPRMVRDLSLSCGNKVRLEMEGQDADLDKSLITAIQDPLMNIVRNAIVHGIETSAERKHLGKPEEGVIKLRAFNQSGQIHVEVMDDGRGLDFSNIKNQALIENHISPEQVDRLKDKDCAKLLFIKGFSVTQQSLIKSAKGNGLNQSRELIKNIGGSLDIESQPGVSTLLKIKIPLTLAIIPALIVSSGSNRFAIPQVNIKELISLDKGNILQQIEEVKGSQFFRLRGELLPLSQLNQILENPPSENESKLNLVVLQVDDIQLGLVVDKIFDSEEIVVKSLENAIKNIDAFSGATILGNGDIVLILDTIKLAKKILATSDRNSKDSIIEAKDSSTNGEEEKQDMLVVNLGKNQQVAFRLSDVTRLEEVKKSTVEAAGTDRVVQYRNEIMPLIDIPKLAKVQKENLINRDHLEVIVHTYEGKSLGLIVGSIQDIVPGHINQKHAFNAPHLYGTIIANGSIVDVLDIKSIAQSYLKTN